MGWFDRLILRDEPTSGDADIARSQQPEAGTVTVSADTMKFSELVKKLESLFESRYGIYRLNEETQKNIASANSALNLPNKRASKIVDELVEKIDFSAIARDALAYHRTVKHEILADGRTIIAGKDLKDAGRQDIVLNEMVGEKVNAEGLKEPVVKTTILKGVPKAAIVAAQINVAKRLMAVDIPAGSFPAAQKTFNTKTGEFDRTESPMSVKPDQSPRTAIKYFNQYFAHTHKADGVWSRGSDKNGLFGHEPSLHLLQWAKAKFADQMGQAGEMAAEFWVYDAHPTKMRDNLDLMQEIFRDNLIDDGIQEHITMGAEKFAREAETPEDVNWREMIVHRCNYAIASKPYLQAADRDLARVAEINLRLCGDDVADLIAAKAIMDQATGQATGMHLVASKATAATPPLQPLSGQSIPTVAGSYTAQTVFTSSGQVVVDYKPAVHLQDITSKASIFNLGSYRKHADGKTISQTYGTNYRQSQKDKRGTKAITADQQANLNMLSGQMSLFADIIIAPKFRKTLVEILKDNPGSPQANLIRTSAAKAALDAFKQFEGVFSR